MYSYDCAYQINLTELARKYNIVSPQNPEGVDKSVAGAVIKEFLEDNGVNLERFDQMKSRCEKPRIRRKIKRSPGGEISMPISRTNEQLRKDISNKITEGNLRKDTYSAYMLVMSIMLIIGYPTTYRYI